MKFLYFLSIIFIICTFSCLNKKETYSDWKVSNLKGKPKKITQNNTYGLPSLLKVNGDNFDGIKSVEITKFNEVGLMVSYEEHKQCCGHFDPCGLTIIKYVHEKGDNNIILKIDYECYTDTEEVYKNNTSVDTIPYFLDDYNFYLSNKTYPTDSLFIDSPMDIFQHSLNKNGDVIKEIYKYDTSTIDTIDYSYIYDNYSNWVVRTSFYKNDVYELSYRDIEYFKD